MPQNSKLALFCEKLIQAGWLLALIVAPLYFNIYTSRVFEPDKISLVRTLALVMGAAWLILRAERWTRAPRSESRAGLGERLRARARDTWRENPLTIPTLLLLGAYTLSTILSVSPTVSFFGSYQRLQGLYTFSAYVIIFFLAASLLRTRADVERAISTALVASFPVAFYGIIQHFFLDPLPWVGDVTTRVASNLGNSIFIGAFLILTIPLAAARLVYASENAHANFSARAKWLLYLAAFGTFLLIAAAWALSFDLGAKNFIESNYSGTLTPAQLTAAYGAFALSIGVSLAALAVWWGAARVLKQRAANFLLIALYAALLAVQVVALVFSQSRGPLLGLLGGVFAFGVLFALARGARKFVVGAIGAAVLSILLLALINIPNSPLSSLRELPYVGRLGRVFELEGGTGRVRVLIWQGALQLALPHEPLWSPTTGDDAFNPLRPLIGYGPETMYVAYNKFYPPELGTLESRNATPDRSHNETFDALVTTGLFGFIAENILFLIIFYFALKWLGLITSARARNIFIAAWFGGGALIAVLFGFALGWEFIGVALPLGMMLGLFAYLVAFALRARHPLLPYTANTLWLIALTALFVAHFIEIHFGIAIVSTRVYFWFFAALFVAIGARNLSMSKVQENVPPTVTTAPAENAPSAKQNKSASRTKNPASAPQKKSAPRAAPTRARRVSASPLITFAFLVGFVLAVLGFDYINTNNVSALGGAPVSGLDIVITALTVKQTTAGGMASLAMLWLLLLTLLMGLGIGLAEWGRTFSLAVRDWLVAAMLFLVLGFAVFSGLAFYHVLLIATTGSGILDALLVSVVLFSAFMFIMAVVIASSMMFDEPMPPLLVRRTTNWVVAPVLVMIAAVLISATNIDPVRADMLYKQALSLSGENAGTGIQLYQRALALQPQQDYYYLFLGRAYLDAAKNTTDGAARAKYLEGAEQALHAARALNPFNTDHSANLARLAQARGALASAFETRQKEYRQASEYYSQATRLSPHTVHLYDQHAQALLEYEQLLREHGDAAAAAQIHAQALAQIERALAEDNSFCLTYAVRAQAQDNWRARVADALETIQRAPACGDVFINEGLGIAVAALARAGDEAIAANERAAFEQILSDAVKTTPSLEAYTTLANYYSKAGRIPEAIQAIDGALAKITDDTTRQRYQDFRHTLVQMQSALDQAQAAPNDVEAQRAVAEGWLARGQFDLALPAFDQVLALDPNNYNALRSRALLLIATNRLAEASQSIKQLSGAAPTQDQTLWQKLDAAVTAIQNGDNTQAITLVEELAKNANQQDFALVSALRALAEKLQGAG